MKVENFVSLYGRGKEKINKYSYLEQNSPRYHLDCFENNATSIAVHCTRIALLRIGIKNIERVLLCEIASASL